MPESEFSDAVTEAFIRRIAEALGRLSRPRAGLECFAREGSFITHRYAQLLDSLECWEINAAYLADLRRNLPGATARQVDSIAYASRSADRFDFISIDNPMGVYGPGYAEHFDILDAAVQLGRASMVVTTNVNLHPYIGPAGAKRFDDYGMTSHEAWFRRRAEFYGRDARDLPPDMVETFYRRRLTALGCRVTGFALVVYPSDVPGNPDYFGRLIAELDRPG